MEDGNFDIRVGIQYSYYIVDITKSKTKCDAATVQTNNASDIGNQDSVLGMVLDELNKCTM